MAKKTPKIEKPAPAPTPAKKRTAVCSACSKPGHNARTCGKK